MSSNTIYLYLKTHNVTGYMYLGKTVSKDPHKYTGSGKLWLRHLNKHGYNYSTKILAECSTAEEVQALGLYYSKKYDIVKSKSFANMMEESGNGGATRGTGWSHTTETIAKLSKPKSNTDNMKKAQRSRSTETSDYQKKLHEDPDFYKKKIASMKTGCHSKESAKKRSKTISTLKWCNDGVRNYRLVKIPDHFFRGRI